MCCHNLPVVMNQANSLHWPFSPVVSVQRFAIKLGIGERRQNITTVKGYQLLKYLDYQFTYHNVQYSLLYPTALLKIGKTSEKYEIIEESRAKSPVSSKIWITKKTCLMWQKTDLFSVSYGIFCVHRRKFCISRRRFEEKLPRISISFFFLACFKV